MKPLFGLFSCLAATALLALPGKRPPLEAAAIPIVFEPNTGQAGPDVRFISRYGASTFLLSEREVRVLVVVPEGRRSARPRRRIPSVRTSSIRMLFPGASANPVMEGIQPLTSRTNYFLGSAKPFSVAQYESLRYAALYPNVDVIYHTGKHGRLEHDFVVQPGGDPSKVRMAF